MSLRPTTALVLTAADNLGLSVIRGLAEAGLSSVVVAEKRCWSTRLSRHCRRFVPMPAGFLKRPEQVGKLIGAICAEEGISLVIPADVPAGLAVARAQKELAGLQLFPVGEAEHIEILDDKWRFFRFLTERGLATPATALLESADSRLPDGFRFPAIVKPVRDSGGRGVRRIDSDSALPAARPLLVQEFVAGRDVDLSVLCDRGELVTWAVQTRDAAGAVLFLSHPGVFDLGRRVVAALGYTGLAHFDLREDAQGRAWMIECNPRFWGSFQYAVSLGADFLAKGLEMARGNVPRRSSDDPIGECPSLRAAAKRLAQSWSLDAVPAASRRYLRQKLGDPLPELSRTVQRLLGLDAGP